MKRWKRSISILVTLLLLVSLIACSKPKSPTITEKPTEIPITNDITEKAVVVSKPYDNLCDDTGHEKLLKQNEYKVDDMPTYTFNSDVTFEGNEDRKNELLEKGKNPGLGIAKLHRQGFTGKGVNVGIIDQPLLLDHPEYKGKIVEYFDTGCDEPADSGSLSGSAVTSLLVGNTIGTAPDTKVYYAAVPAPADAKHYTDALGWIVAKNKELPQDQKIRVVSVSTAVPDNQSMWEQVKDAAKNAGILVIARENDDRLQAIGPAFYSPEDSENITSCFCGLPSETSILPNGQIGVPCSYRTVAEASTKGNPKYRYVGEGDVSFSIPYTVGLLALGFADNPTLDGEILWNLFIHSCSFANNNTLINPTAFLRAVRKTKLVPKPDFEALNSERSQAGLPLLYENLLHNQEKSVYTADEYCAEDLFTYTFKASTTFEGNEELKNEIIEKGKDPGLGIRDLHKQGITGKGINVGIIDQPLLLHHSEFDGKIAAYYDTGCNVPENQGSMHGPAVTSLLVGNTIGVAPDARVYYAAAPSWYLDSKYCAMGLNWIIEENRKLPKGQKIRVVSVSASPSGSGSPFTKNHEMWDEAVATAQAEGILVLDCRVDAQTGILAPAGYSPRDPQDISLCYGGFIQNTFTIGAADIGVPLHYRTVAYQWTEDSPDYLYGGIGGLSWGIPYGAGVLSLGWQINPKLDKDQIVQLLQDTTSPGADWSNMINPPAFIEAVRKTLD